MKHKKIISALAFTAALSVTLTGCFPTGQKSAPTQDNSVSVQNNSVPAQNNSDSDYSSSGTTGVENLSVNVDFAENYPAEVPVISLKLRVWDKEKIKAAMLNGRTVTDEQDGTELDPNYHLITLDDGSDIICGSSIDGAFLQYKANGNIAKSQQNMIRPSIAMIYPSNPTAEKEIYDLDLAYEKGELTNFSRADAKTKADKILSDLGIANAGEPKIYSVPSDKINELNKDKTYGGEKDGEHLSMPKVAEDDGVYVIKYPIKYGEVSLPMHLTPGQFLGSRGTYIDMIVSKKELVYFRYYSPFDEEYETGETVKFKADAKAAADILVDDFSKQLITEKTEIFSCDLIYVSFKTTNETTVEMHPMWCFGIASRTDDGTLQKIDYKYVDPVLCTVVSSFG